jgi:hypothetical protein
VHGNRTTIAASSISLHSGLFQSWQRMSALGG